MPYTKDHARPTFSRLLGFWAFGILGHSILHGRLYIPYSDEKARFFACLTAWGKN
jgi:hypothetical protein